jgi:hypothetical protein
MFSLRIGNLTVLRCYYDYDEDYYFRTFLQFNSELLFVYFDVLLFCVYFNKSSRSMKKVLSLCFSVRELQNLYVEFFAVRLDSV